MNERTIAILFTILAISCNFWYMGVPVVLLNVGLVISFFCWLSFKKQYGRSLTWLFITGITIQIFHFFEEYYTGFYKALPALFNAPAWAPAQFVTFNIIWLIIFLLAAIGTVKKMKLSYFMLWFFVLIGAIGNGIMHIGLSLVRQAYFPGTITAILLLFTGIIMLQKILKTTNGPG